MPNELIEAMARAYTGAPFPSRAAIRKMTAAYTALRNALEPVGWCYINSSTASVRYFAERQQSDGYAKTGWIETPLYTLPEIKP